MMWQNAQVHSKEKVAANDKRQGSLSTEMLKQQFYNAKSDIWALGTLLYEFITLRVPAMAWELTLSSASTNTPYAAKQSLSSRTTRLPVLLAFSNITTATISRESSCATVILTICRPPNTISNRGYSTATSICRSREMSRKLSRKL